MLSKGEIEQIHSASLRILERTGIVVNSVEARSLLRRAGVEVSEDQGRAFISEGLVKEALRSTAKEFTLGARDPKQDLKVPNPRGFPYLSTDGYPVQILDSDTLQKRSTLRSDLENWARLADAVDAVDFLWPSTTPTDLPPKLQFVAGLRTSYENTSKHVQYQAVSGEQARFQIEMACAVAGSEKENRKRPHFSSVQCVVAPLQFDGHPTDAAIEFAKAGVPIVAMSMVTPGMTGPISLAGSAALANAEVLASVVISNIARKGARVIYCFVCAPLDMKSGNFVMGAPEYPVLEIAGTELARHYRIPSMMSAMGDTGKTAGFQLGMEKGFTSAAVAFAGCDLLTGIGGLNDTSFVSMEQMLMDAEVWESVRRSWEGMEVNQKEIALDVIEKVGPKGQFLNTPHTFANFRRLYTPKLGDWSSYAAWDKAGRKDMFSVAQNEVRRILSTHRPKPLPSDAAEKLEEIERRARAALC
jgi:trimethylamine--corrinoid protein Co-methyltransferase